MPCRVASRGLRSVLAVGLSLAALASSAIAQPAGAARGLVVDRQGNAVDGPRWSSSFRELKAFVWKPPRAATVDSHSLISLPVTTWSRPRRASGLAELSVAGSPGPGPSR